MTLRTRLLLALLGLMAAGLLVAGLVTYSSLRAFLLERVDAQLRDARSQVAYALTNGTQALPGQLGAAGQASLPPGTYGELRTTEGQVLNRVTFAYGSEKQPVPELPATLPGSSGNDITEFVAKASTGAASFRVLVQPFPDVNRVLVVAEPLTETRQTLGRLLALELIVFGLVLAGLGVAAWLIIKRDLHPLEDMAGAAGRIAAGDLTQRVEPAEDRTEVGRLGLSLNVMLDQIETAFAERTRSEEKLRRFLADASHELRTPLTSIRGYAEMFARTKENPDDLATSMRRIEEESKRMGVMVDELLLLARIGEGRTPERAPVDLARVVSDAVADARAADPGRPFTLDAPTALLVTGDDLQLRQVVANLLGNARTHTPPGTAVRMTLRGGDGAAATGRAASRQPGRATAVLTVADDGPGMEPDVAAKVFEPFYRADKSRSRQLGGAGLGLAIVAAIVEAHGGSVSLATAPGAGAAFTVALPLAAGAAAAPDPRA